MKKSNIILAAIFVLTLSLNYHLFQANQMHDENLQVIQEDYNAALAAIKDLTP